MLLTFTAWFFGLLRGMGHALEPDHLAAVSTLVAETKGVSRVGMVLGAAWGAGHTFMLLLVGGGLFVARGHMPPALEHGFELLVALMLVVLGVRALLGARKKRVEPAAHAHGAPRGRWSIARRPLVIGSIHGLAGSGALTAAVVAEMPNATSGLVYMLLFGAGSAMGMAVLSGAVGASFARVARSERATPLLLVASGVLSLTLGLVWGIHNAREMLGAGL